MTSITKIELLGNFADKLCEVFTLQKADVHKFIDDYFDGKKPAPKPAVKPVVKPAVKQTKGDLLQRAKDLNLKVSSKMTKDEILKLIEGFGEVKPNEEKPQTVIIKKMTKNELMDIAKGMNLKVSSKMKKEEIQKLIDDCTLEVLSEENEPKLVEENQLRQPLPRKAKGDKPEGGKPEPEGGKPKPKAKKGASSLIGMKVTSMKTTWTVGNILGSGGYGGVYEVEEDENLVIKLGDPFAKFDSGIFCERNLYQRIKGDNKGIPKLADFGTLQIEGKKEYFIVLPKYKMDLISFCEKNDPKTFEKKFVNQMLENLKTLSSHMILHRDIKPGNIMVDSNDNFILVDFGIGKRITVEKEMLVDGKYAGEGTPRYRAREAEIGQYSRKGDLEALLYTLIELNGFSLFRDMRKNETEKEYYQYLYDEKKKFFENYKDSEFMTNVENKEYYTRLVESIINLEPGTTPDFDSLKME